MTNNNHKQTRQEKRAKRKKNLSKMRVHGRSIKKQAKKGKKAC